MPPRQEAGSGLLGFLFVLVVPILLAAVLVPAFCVHKVEEGHIGLYWRGGALLPEVTEPGIHFYIPLLTTYANVQTTLQTDTVTNIPCGTSGGVMIYFDKVEVVNRLDRAHAFNTIKNYGVHYDKLWIFDKIHHEINQFCSAHSLQEVYIDKFDRLDESLAKALQADCTKYDTGIEVIAIRVTKPRIPEGVERNYQLVEEQKTRLLVATQEQLVATKQAETQRVQAKIHAEREAEVALINARREAQVETINAEKAANVSRIHQSKLTEEATANSQRSLIENEAHVKKERALAEATSFKILQEAEANKHLLTPAYLQKLLYESIASNTKIFFGSNIPQIFLDWADRDGQAADLSKIVRLPVDNKKVN